MSLHLKLRFLVISLNIISWSVVFEFAIIYVFSLSLSLSLSFSLSLSLSHIRTHNHTNTDVHPNVHSFVAIYLRARNKKIVLKIRLTYFIWSLTLSGKKLITVLHTHTHTHTHSLI